MPAKSHTPYDTGLAVSKVPPRSGAGLQLEIFGSIPGGIDGCGEYFTLDTSRFARDNYVFVSDLSEKAYIKVNGKTVLLTKDKNRSKSSDDNNYIAVYTGNGFSAILEAQQKAAYDEGGFYTGTLRVIGPNVDARFKVHGEAGC